MAATPTTPTTPSTTSQVQAHRFTLRRIESALVRRVAVPLHDPARNHIRAGLAGLFLALLALAGVIVLGFFAPRATLGTADEIVVSAESGAVYVHLNNPVSRLVPATNLASARLILIKVAGPAEVGNAAAATPRRVSDRVLDGVAREPLTGIPGAPVDIPRPGELVGPAWSLCDTSRVVDATAPASGQADGPALSTTVMAGVDGPGRELGDREALLVRSAANGRTYLVYRGRQGEVRRAEVELADRAVVLALDLDREQASPRPMSIGLLNAIPEAGPLRAPDIADRDRRPLGYQVGGHLVGEVVRTDRAEGARFYVLLRSGRQEIPRSLANLIRARGTSDVEIPAVPLGVIAAAPPAVEADRLALDDYPPDVPAILPPHRAPVACLFWRYLDGRQVSVITVGDRLVLPDGQRPVRLAQADDDPAGGAGAGGAGNGTAGDSVDYFYLPPGRGAAVRAVAPEQPPDTGAIFLVTDLGAKYGVPAVAGASGVQLAAALGLRDLQPAPVAILRLLPTGAALDPNAVQSFDTPPVGAGVDVSGRTAGPPVFEPTGSDPAAGGSGGG